MSTKRERLRREFWPDEEDTWTGEEAGWFKIPRSLPLIFSMLKKDVRGPEDPTSVYLELLSHHYGEGFIELKHETDHAFAVGFSKGRTRSWLDRMAKLEELGFIKSKSSGARKYAYILLMHPTSVIQKLRDAGKLEEASWNAYVARKAETKELSFADREKAKKLAAKGKKTHIAKAKSSMKVKTPISA